MIDSAKNILKSLKADPVTCAGIASEIKNAPIHNSKNHKSMRNFKIRNK